MLFSIIAFGISFLLLVALIGLKLAEEKRGRIPLLASVSRFGENLYKRLHPHVKAVPEALPAFDVIAFYRNAKQALAKHLMAFHRVTSKTVVSVTDRLNGKRPPATRNSVSIFLRHIIDFKSKLPRHDGDR